jgi:hypothetical protein
MKYPSLKRAASLDPRTKSQTEDLQPWYRQFWPWFLIALPGCAVVASLYTLNLAIQTTDSLVVESNLGMDVIAAQHIAAAEKAAALGLSATLTLDRDTGAIQLSLASSASNTSHFAGNDLLLHFSHPAFRDRDLDVLLQRAEDTAADYSTRLPAIPDGRWYLVLESALGWRMTAVIDGGTRIVSFDSRTAAFGGHDE